MTVTRRTFMKAASAAAATLKTSLETETAAGAVPAKAAVATERTSTSYAFLSQREASFIESAVARLIPSDSVGPGATEAGVPNYIDKQLSGAWGAGNGSIAAAPGTQASRRRAINCPSRRPSSFAMRSVRSTATCRRNSGRRLPSFPPTTRTVI